MLCLLALYSILITTSFSRPEHPSSNEGQTDSVSNPPGSFEIITDSSFVSLSTPLDATNKLTPSSIPPLDDTTKILSNLPSASIQQNQIEVPPETTPSAESPFIHIPFDPKPEPSAAFNQALIDGDEIPSFPLLDLLWNIPSNINIPNFGEGSSGQKPIDPNPDPVDKGEEEGEQPRYDPQERVENPTPPECGEGRFAMCCNQGPSHSRPTVPQEQVWHKRRLCRLFGTNWEGCHWRQNVFCCVCKDKYMGAYGCFSPIYNNDPYYTPYGNTERPPPPPEYFARPTIGENVPRRSGQEPQVKLPPPPPQPPESMGPPKVSAPGERGGARPFLWEKTNVLGRPRRSSTCTPEQLQYYGNGGTGVF